MKLNLQNLGLITVIATLAFALLGCSASINVEEKPQNEAATTEKQILSAGAKNYAAMHSTGEIQTMIDNHYESMTDEGKAACLLALGVSKAEKEILDWIKGYRDNRGALYSSVTLTGYYPDEPVFTNTSGIGNRYDFSAKISYTGELTYNGKIESESKTVNGCIVLDIDDKYVQAIFN